MNETFKINVYFDEKGEEIENLIVRFLSRRINAWNNKNSNL